MNTFYTILLVISVVLAILAIILFYIQNKFVVEPNNRERMVLQNVLTGEMDVLPPGTYLRGPEWKELEKVELNREPVRVPKEEKDPGEEFGTADAIRGVIRYRYDILTGRPFDPQTGQLTVNPDDITAIDERIVLLAVTRIDYGQRRQRVQEIIEAAVEDVLSHYTAQQLFPRADEYRTNPVFVPLRDMPELGITRQQIQTKSDLHAALSQYIEAVANKSLTFVGINVVDFRIADLAAKDTDLQKRVEQDERAKRISESAATMQAASNNELSYREALAATDPAAFGPIAAAQAERFKAEQYGQGAARVGEAIRDGLKNFGLGRGEENPPPPPPEQRNE